VIGHGTPASCTSQAVVAAVAAGGVITFSCGPNPMTIAMSATAKVRNNAGPKVVLDGGGLVTLSGGGSRRILYMNTCDSAQGITTSHCQDQDSPRLTLQNLTLADGNSTGDTTEGGGGGSVGCKSASAGDHCHPVRALASAPRAPQPRAARYAVPARSAVLGSLVDRRSARVHRRSSRHQR